MCKYMGRKLSFCSSVLLAISFLIYSTTDVFSKMASEVEMLSVEYFIYFSLVLLTMTIYAILWQVVLKKVPLTQAFLFKSITVVFSLFFAFLLFNEVITRKNLIGATLIIVGIILNALDSSKV